MKEKFLKFCLELKKEGISSEEKKKLFQKNPGFAIRYLTLKTCPNEFYYRDSLIKEYRLIIKHGHNEHEEIIYKMGRSYEIPFNMENFLLNLGYKKLNLGNPEMMASVKFLLKKDNKIWSLKYDNIDLFDTGFYEAKLVKVELN